MRILVNKFSWWIIPAGLHLIKTWTGFGDPNLAEVMVWIGFGLIITAFAIGGNGERSA